MTRGILIAAVLVLGGAATAETVRGLHEKELRAIDKNNDGFLSRDEYNDFSDYAYQAMDEDRDGSVGLEEAKPHLGLEQFRKVDRNNDNFISRPEYDAQMGDDFEAADKNQNGILD
ncbi:hypothetical protein [Ruegeria arenilitoris]|uniref:hypothetical protein n=1 Tax=Ruegeria arenilitoris TaxID=1173585 RepID=UPI0020C40472|nr:hypothetical protein [Ruegeria arenilitoris]